MGGRILLSIVVALWALLIAATSYWYHTAKSMLQEEFDHGLSTEVGTLATLLDHEGTDVELDFADELLPHFRPGPMAAYFQIWRLDGTVVERSQSMRNDDVVLVQEVAALEEIEPIEVGGTQHNHDRQQYKIDVVGAQELRDTLATCRCG